MRIEAAVFDGDESLGQIGRQVLQRDVGAGHFAALRQQCRPCRRSGSSADAWEFPATGSAADGRRPRSRRRSRRSRPTGSARRPNRRGGRGRRRRRISTGAWRRAVGLRLALARRLVVGCSAFALAGGFFRLVRRRGIGNAIGRRQAQIGERRGQAEQRLLPPTLFLSRPHTQTPGHPAPPHASGRV